MSNFSESLKKNIDEIIVNEAKNNIEGREEKKPIAWDTYPEVELLNDRVTDVLKNNAEDIEKLNGYSEKLFIEIEALVKPKQTNTSLRTEEKNSSAKEKIDEDKEKVIVDLETILFKCAKATFSIMAAETNAIAKKTEKEKSEGKPKVAYSFAQGESWHPAEEWELHNQYILEVFNPQTTAYGPKKSKEELEPGETLEKVPATKEWALIAGADSIVEGTAKFPVSIGASLIYGFFSSLTKKELYVTVRKSQQAPNLDNIPIEDAPNKDKKTSQSVDEYLNQNLAIKELFNKMASDVYNETEGALQSDQIIELYDKAHKISHYDYPYTDHERRSPFYAPKKLQGNELEPRGAVAVVGAVATSLLAGVGAFAGQAVGHLFNTSVRFGAELYPAIVFLRPQKCQ